MSGYLIFGGIDSRDYDVFVSFSDIDTVPRRVYTKVDIVGKNGAVLIDEGKYEDVPHSYDCIVLDNEKRVAFVNAIMSKKGYQRLTDSYGTDEYYTAVLEENIEQKTTRIRDKYKFKLIFTRKPQRFLTSGEEPVDTSELGGEVTTDKIPYLFRRSGGGNIGHDFDAEIDKIIGGTVAWNQLVQNGNFADTSGWNINRATFSVSGNVATFSNLTADNPFMRRVINAPANHKYLICITAKGKRNFNINLQLRNEWDVVASKKRLATTSYTALYELFSITQSANYVLYEIEIDRHTSSDVLNFMDAQIIDLTALFGSAEIADYVYNLEQTTEGSGIAWLKSHGFFTKDYYAYDSGSLQSVKTSEHRTVEKNLIPSVMYQNSTSTVIFGQDNGTDYGVRLNAGTYTISVQANKLVNFYIRKSEDSSHTHIGNYNVDKATFTLSEDSNIRIWAYADTGLSVSDISTVQLELGSTATEYEPYESHSYPLDPNLELRGKFKLDANNNLYADGDVYESSGAVTRKYGYRAYQSGDESLTDAITDGTNTVYKLTTPTTETADPYANPQVVSPYGTEEYVDSRDVPVPVGHETKYGMSQLVLTNPTEFPSKPLLEVTGVGTFWLGDTLFTIMGTAGQTIYIDCETGEAWKNTGGIITPANGLVTLNRLDFPELDPGDTPVMYGTGITKVVVTPRWWRL